MQAPLPVSVCLICLRIWFLFVLQLDHPTFPENSILGSSPSDSTEEHASFVSDETQPLVLYRPAEQRGSGRRRWQRACAINIEGLDDLYSGTSQGSNTISVHECRWAKPSNPCRTWLIGSRSRVGAHMRRWHTQAHADGTANCL